MKRIVSAFLCVWAAAVFYLSGCENYSEVPIDDSVISDTSITSEAFSSENEQPEETEKKSISHTTLRETESTLSTEQTTAVQTTTVQTTVVQSAAIQTNSQETSSVKKTVPAAGTAAPPETTAAKPETFAVTETTVQTLSVEKDGSYTTPEDVAEYIHTFGTLPKNFITKAEARKLGWDNKKGNLWDVADGKSIGGDYFGNYEELLPKAEGREYTECDVNYSGGYRGGERIVFSNDGLIYYTNDHYQTFTQLY